ncbi:Zn-dependent hydrolase GumP [Deinococcus aerius]|uniref:Zn-dependent hydrolase GumP n=1 Tax=Deinococcus aerius TaxID=200253 RepID=A0A2I9DZC4_9DEIO|nr:MBL fold metallo-hydrolase [Deinococcus aerius]GBF06345.1 Zn-dependent hydrolase GumP [Deinococcus aerius]
MTDVAVRVVPLVAGECLNIAALTERGASWRVRAYPAGFALLRHPERGPMLFDTGYGPGVLRAMRRWPGVLYGLVTPVRLSAEETVPAHLARHGLTPGDIRDVIVSHLHADHVGALRDLPQARFHLDPGAYAPLRRLQGVRAVRRAFLPDLLPPDFGARIQPLDFRPAPPGLAPFERAADVFGDGSVYALPVPGHAPGMVALVVRTRAGARMEGDGSGLTLLASDAAYSVRGLREGREVHPLTRLVFFDPARERLSRRRLGEWLRTHPRARVIVSHDEPEPEDG